MEVVIDYEYLTGTQTETVIKEMSTAGENVLETFQFQSPYAMRPHGDTENGLNWDGVHTPTIEIGLNEAVAGFTQFYAYGSSKCTFHNCWGALCIISKISTALNPATSDRNSVVPNCHRNPSFRCAIRHAHCLHEWLMYHLQCLVNCPHDKTRHTACFVSAV